MIKDMFRHQNPKMCILYCPMPVHVDSSLQYPLKTLYCYTFKIKFLHDLITSFPSQKLEHSFVVKERNSNVL